LHQVIRTGVAPKRLEKILADIIYGVGDVPELVELLLKHGATPTSSSFSAVTTYGHANVHTTTTLTLTLTLMHGLTAHRPLVQCFRVMLSKLSPAEIKRRPLLASSTRHLY
jgi:hypothetical protein